MQMRIIDVPGAIEKERQMTEQDKYMTEHQERQLHRAGDSPGYRAFHEVYLTKDLGSQRNQEVIDFIDKHIAEYKGKTEDKHGIPLMLFERSQDARKFALELGEKLNIHQDHITVKAQKFTR
jgi:hypothetical protein